MFEGHILNNYKMTVGEKVAPTGSWKASLDQTLVFANTAKSAVNSAQSVTKPVSFRVIEFMRHCGFGGKFTRVVNSQDQYAKDINIIPNLLICRPAHPRQPATLHLTIFYGALNEANTATHFTCCHVTEWLWI